MIVAIARELGAGGHAVGEAVARLLRVELLDNEIVDLVAARMGAPTSYVAERDEQVESFADRLIRVFTAAHPEEYGAQALPDWSEDRLVQLTNDIIKEHAASASLVVIGRGAPMLLKDRPDVLRVFVTAPNEVRIKRVCERTSVTLEEAAREIKKSDQRRTAYLKEHYGVEWREPHNYDIVVDTGRFTIDQAAQLIVDAATLIESHE
ncbi:MAG TPA: cytidylate kinase-like family protein [Candidatus Tumulicola sp.]|nr:cytidylate kinase-like family protein [Candidatus Tumulicola sp.]